MPHSPQDGGLLLSQKPHQEVSPGPSGQRTIKDKFYMAAQAASDNNQARHSNLVVGTQVPSAYAAFTVRGLRDHLPKPGQTQRPVMLG